MSDKSWEQFQKTGRVADYLRYCGVYDGQEMSGVDLQKEDVGAVTHGNNHSTDGNGSVGNANWGIR